LALTGLEYRLLWRAFEVSVMKLRIPKKKEEEEEEEENFVTS
jgi:hypothetical protein